MHFNVPTASWCDTTHIRIFTSDNNKLRMFCVCTGSEVVEEVSHNAVGCELQNDGGKH